jgi:nicotinamidase-related amidase
MMNSALLIIDMLNDFFEQQSRLANQRTDLVASINALVHVFHSHGQPIIWIRQEFAPDLSDAFLEMRKRNIHMTITGTQGCRLLPELNYHPSDLMLVKKRYSAFFGTDLDELLKQLRPGVVVVAGINTHACVRTTVIDAYQRDYEVVVATDCIASYDEAHHEMSKQYLDGIAALLSNSEIIKLVEA